uniref:Dna-binding protein n=1 Tax=Lutzomyia longipalpis TaxID=7200 RepID=A0A1B0GKG5_LUTLO
MVGGDLAVRAPTVIIRLNPVPMMTIKSSEYEAEKIRVGRDYQAVCPELINPMERKVDQLNDRALLVWSPTKEIPDAKLEEYITVAKEKYGYNGEQALGMLFWHKHDLARAESDLANFTPFPDEWTAEDKVLFEQAFQFHGKSFHRIRQMLPDKSIPSLVKYYYSWKKTRSRTSVMDRQEKIKKNESSENGSENGSNEESDSDEKVRNGPFIVVFIGPVDHPLEESKMIRYQALQQASRRTGNLRPTTGPSCFGKRSKNSHDKHKRKPPRGMHINHDDIVALANPDNDQANRNDELLGAMDREIVSLWCQSD